MIWAMQLAGKGVEYYYIVGNLCLRYVDWRLLHRCNYLRRLAKWGRRGFVPAVCLSIILI